MENKLFQGFSVFHKSYTQPNQPFLRSEAFQELQSLEKMGKAAAGRITLRTKEYPALVHAYKGSLVLT
ncbi:MAG: hypothetical protein MUO24_10675, partial [Desulfobacterales bacterium]|nr:hypothetical protein [Desulfobacterales bacterium]